MTISSTGIDAGTGDVTINATNSGFVNSISSVSVNTIVYLFILPIAVGKVIVIEPEAK